MSRRRSARRPKRVSVNFWKQGDPHPYPGYTTNISMTGMFIGTRSPMPGGTRVRVEVLGERGFVVEGVVAHARKIRGELARIAQSGMGVRFLSPEELVREVIPGAVVTETEPIPESPWDQEVDFDPPIAEPPPAVTAPPPPPPVATVAAPLPPPVRAAQPVGPGVFAVHFPSPRHFLDVFERDIKNGGLFVATRFPGRLSEMVTIEIHPPESEPILVRARVVQRFEPSGASVLSGMGVELFEPQEVYQKLRPIAGRLAGG